MHSFFRSALAGSEWSTSYSSWFTPEERTPLYPINKIQTQYPKLQSVLEVLSKALNTTIAVNTKSDLSAKLTIVKYFMIMEVLKRFFFLKGLY